MYNNLWVNTMLAIRLPESLEEHLTKLTKVTHRSKSYYIKRALQDFLDEQEEHLIAHARLEKKFPYNTC